MADKAIRSFQDLHCWQAAYELAIDVYKLTSTFPDSEKFGLTNQLRRASVSVSSNIAEGFARKGVKEKIQFYHMAKGSLAEVESQLLIAVGIGYVTAEQYEALHEISQKAGKLLTGLLHNIPES